MYVEGPICCWYIRLGEAGMLPRLWMARETKYCSAMDRNITKRGKFSVDSGMVVVILISMGFLVMVFGLLFYVKNDWCDLLFKNMTVI